MNATSSLHYLPWTWTVKSSNPNAHCPPASSILGTFAIVNVLVSIFGLISGNRIVVNKLSCGLLGKLGSKGWRYMWILTLALQFGSNILVAIMIKHTPGYGNDFSLPELMMFFIARPRLSWIVLSMFSNLKSKIGSFGQSERPWEGSFLSQLIAEVILQVINMYTMGRIVHFAAIHGYYIINHEYHLLPQAAHLIYAGALLYILAMPGILFTIPSFLALSVKWDDDEEKTGISDGSSFSVQVFVWTSAITTWLASWLLWSGYILLMGDLYCPPKLLQQGVIWTTFSSIAIFTGTGI